MPNNKYVPIEAIIGRIDNDFNIDNSDWIPRVSVWVMQILTQLDAIKHIRVRQKIKPNLGVFGTRDTIRFSEDNIKVYTINGCEIKRVDVEDFASIRENCAVDEEEDKGLDSDYNNDFLKHLDEELTPETLVVHNNQEAVKDIGCVTCIDTRIIANSDTYTYTKINRGFKTNYPGDIIIEYNSPELEYSDTFDCEFPLIPNIGAVVECVINFCMYKLLCRGYKHPVFNLSNNPAANPYLIYKSLLPEAKRAVINANQNLDDAADLMRSNFFISTFDPRD